MSDKLSDLLSTLGVQESDELFAIYNEEEYGQLISAAETLEQRVEGLPAVKISDGDVWLIFPNASISIESICNSRAPGPIVKKNLRAWRDKALATKEE